VKFPRKIYVALQVKLLKLQYESLILYRWNMRLQ